MNRRAHRTARGAAAGEQSPRHLGTAPCSFKPGGSVYRAEWGKQKAPTLRNLDLRPSKKFVKAYAHNGYFKNLEEIVRFYNTRDVPSAGWLPPEVDENVNTTEMGNLGSNHAEELVIVAFLRTLSDGYVPKK